MALLVGLVGIWIVATQILGGLLSISTSQHLISGGWVLPMRTLTIAVGIWFLLLARALARGSRLALISAIAMMVAVVLGRAAIDPDVIEISVGLMVAAVLLAALGSFPSTSGRDWRPALKAGTLVAVSAVGLYLVYALSLAATQRYSGLGSALPAAVHMLKGDWWIGPHWPFWLILPGFIASLIIGGVMLLRAVLLPERPGEGHLFAEHVRAVGLLDRFSCDSLHPFTLREDKSLHFAAGGYLAYRVLRETAVVSGDPVGPPGSSIETLADFRAGAERRGWQVVITGASEEFATAATSLGMRTLRIGEEAIVDPRRFSLEGRTIRKVRQSVTRARRLGWTVEVVPASEVSADLARELEQVDAEWRRSRERIVGFAMTLGRPVSADEDPGGLYVTGRDPQGKLRSFSRFAAFSAGLSLDVMRRTGGEPNGLTEAEIVAALEYARERDMHEVSLNFAGFAHLMAADAVLSHGQRVLRMILRALHSRFQLERLVRFNSKFAPFWRPRFLVYEHATSLPIAALRVLQAEAYLPGPSDAAKSGRWEGSTSAPVVTEPPRHQPVPRRRPGRQLAWLAPGLVIWALLATASVGVSSTVRPAGTTVVDTTSPGVSRPSQGRELMISHAPNMPGDHSVADGSGP